MEAVCVSRVKINIVVTWLCKNMEPCYSKRVIATFNRTNVAKSRTKGSQRAQDFMVRSCP